MCGLHAKSRLESGVDIYQGKCFNLCSGSGGDGSSLSLTEVECLGVGFELTKGRIFDLDGGFIVIVVVVKAAVVRSVWGCQGKKMYIFEGFESNFGVRLIGIVMLADFFQIAFLLGQCHQGKLTGEKMEMEVVVGIVVDWLQG